MTKLLEMAVNKISMLSENEQDEIAKIILDEIEDEKVWYDKFKNSQNELSILADEALREFKPNINYSRLIPDGIEKHDAIVSITF